MTDGEWIELGRRALACEHFRWMPGMAWVIPPEARGAWPARLHHGRYPIPKGLVPIPDMRDPATRGCVLALIREARGFPTTSTSAASALVAALEATSE